MCVCLCVCVYVCVICNIYIYIYIYIYIIHDCNTIQSIFGIQPNDVKFGIRQTLTIYVKYFVDNIRKVCSHWY